MDQLKEASSSVQTYIMVTLAFLIFYTLLSSFLEERHLPLHRSAVAILVGILFGFLLFISSPSAYAELSQLNQVIIFSILFPPMLFAQGYTLKKNAIMKNIKYLLIFGVLGSFLSFLISAFLIYEANNLNLVIDINDVHNFRTLSDWEVLLLAACLCSIDTLASQEAVSEKKFPKLNSIIFGEDIIKDTVTIVLFKSILNLEERESPEKLIIYWYTFFQVLLNFIILILGSAAAGIFSGFLISFAMKKFRFILKDQGITETALLFLSGFLTYTCSEALAFSGGISILVLGLILNHYNFYNMSAEGTISSKNTFLFISTVCEGALFLIMGIMVWQGSWENPSSDDDKMTHSYIFFAVVLGILAFARVANIYLLSFLASKITRNLK